MAAATAPKHQKTTKRNYRKSPIDFLNLSGHMAERINCTGRYMDRSQTFEDVTGKVRTIGTGQWIPTSGMKGTADISATINGRSVKIEIMMTIIGLMTTIINNIEALFRGRLYPGSL